MGYRGKVELRLRARQLRAMSWTMPDIARELKVSKSSVSLWTHDVEFEPYVRRSTARKAGPHPQHLAKLAQIEELNREGIARVGVMSEQAFLAAGVALYIGEGAKRDGEVALSNSDPNVIAFYCKWLRHFFPVNEARMKVVLYLHEGLDLEAAVAFWSDLTGIPPAQFGKAYRAVPDVGIRHNKHEHGCVKVRYCCSKTHRAIMGLSRALLLEESFPG